MNLKELFSHARFQTSVPFWKCATVADGHLLLSVPLANDSAPALSFPFFSGQEANMWQWLLGLLGHIVVYLFGKSGYHSRNTPCLPPHFVLPLALPSLCAVKAIPWISRSCPPGDDANTNDIKDSPIRLPTCVKVT